MGKGGAKAISTPSEKEVLIDGQYYDVAAFEKRHPGGSVIAFYTGNGIDATQAYNSFHIRSKKANAILKSIPHREADAKTIEAQRLPGQTALMKDFDDLQKSLIAEGFFNPAPLHVAFRVAEIIVMHAVGFYLLFNTNYTVLAIIVLGIVSGRCGWLMHEGGHYSLTGNIAVDRGLQIILYGVGCGMSGGWCVSSTHSYMRLFIRSITALLTNSCLVLPIFLSGGDRSTTSITQCPRSWGATWTWIHSRLWHSLRRSCCALRRLGQL